MTHHDELAALERQKATADRRESRIKLATAAVAGMTALATLLGVLLGFSQKKVNEATAQAGNSDQQVQALRSENADLRNQVDQLRATPSNSAATPSTGTTGATGSSAPSATTPQISTRRQTTTNGDKITAVANSNTTAMSG